MTKTSTFPAIIETLNATFGEFTNKASTGYNHVFLWKASNVNQGCGWEKTNALYKMFEDAIKGIPGIQITGFTNNKGNFIAIKIKRDSAHKHPEVADIISNVLGKRPAYSDKTTKGSRYTWEVNPTNAEKALIEASLNGVNAKITLKFDHPLGGCPVCNSRCNHTGMVATVAD